MSNREESPGIYKNCDHIKRIVPTFEADLEMSKRIATNFRVLPTFEKTMYDSVKTKYYSLERNELLKCRWAEYKRQIESRVFSPFQFPDNRDIHFFKGCVRLLPSETIRTTDNHRFHMTAGPGVDSRGHIPIPRERFMKRGIEKAEKRRSSPSKAGAEEKNTGKDIHFFKGCVRLLPSETIRTTDNHRFHMTAGPGVDSRGHIPIPRERFMKRGIEKAEKRRSSPSKAGAEEKNTGK